MDFEYHKTRAERQCLTPVLIRLHHFHSLETTYRLTFGFLFKVAPLMEASYHHHAAMPSDSKGLCRLLAEGFE